MHEGKGRRQWRPFAFVCSSRQRMDDVGRILRPNPRIAADCQVKYQAVQIQTVDIRGS